MKKKIESTKKPITAQKGIVSKATGSMSEGIKKKRTSPFRSMYIPQAYNVGTTWIKKGYEYSPEGIKKKSKTKTTPEKAEKKEKESKVKEKKVRTDYEKRDWLTPDEFSKLTPDEKLKEAKRVAKAVDQRVRRLKKEGYEDAYIVRETKRKLENLEGVKAETTDRGWKQLNETEMATKYDILWSFLQAKTSTPKGQSEYKENVFKGTKKGLEKKGINIDDKGIESLIDFYEKKEQWKFDLRFIPSVIIAKAWIRLTKEGKDADSIMEKWAEKLADSVVDANGKVYVDSIELARELNDYFMGSGFEFDVEKYKTPDISDDEDDSASIF